MSNKVDRAAFENLANDLSIVKGEPPAFAVSGDQTLAYTAVPLALITLAMDWFDGVVARKWDCQSKIGGLLDIAGDRIVEHVGWLIFARLQLMPLWVPVIVLSRGFLIDTLRSYALSRDTRLLKWEMPIPKQTAQG